MKRRTTLAERQNWFVAEWADAILACKIALKITHDEDANTAAWDQWENCERHARMLLVAADYQRIFREASKQAASKYTEYAINAGIEAA